MFGKLLLIVSAISSVDGYRYLRGPGTTPPIANMSTALTIIPQNKGLYSNKQSENNIQALKPLVVYKSYYNPIPITTWTKQVALYNLTKTDL